MQTDSSPALNRVLAKLNDQQRDAALQGRSPLLIVAGAGTGKTTTLAHRVACLIAGGVSPDRILLLTFTRRSSAEMLRRVDGILHELTAEGTRQQNGEDDSTPHPTRKETAGAKVWGGTYHAIATRLLKRYGQRIGLPVDFTILDRADSEDLMNVLRNELRLCESEPDEELDRRRERKSRFPLKGTCMAIYSRAVNSGTPVKQLLQEHYPWCIDHEEKLKKLFTAYVDRKEEHAVLDFDDLLAFWKAMLEDPDVGPTIRGRFDCVLVDEYQDTNFVQSDILRGLAPDGEGLTVVGDDAQSIYSFRAATVRNILDFPTQYPGTTIVKLEQNYRSTQPILDATNTVIAAAKERHRKDLWTSKKEGPRPQLVTCLDEDEQAKFIIDRILARREQEVKLSEQAVLFRASHHSMLLEVQLRNHNIPYHKFGGLKFIETAHVKDTIAFLRLAENPRDVVAGTRILMLMSGIGPASARRLMSDLSASAYNFSIWRTANVPKDAKLDWPLFVALMVTLGDPSMRKGRVAEQLEMIRRFYTPLLEKQYDHWRSRLVDLEQLETIATRYRDRSEFLTEMSLDPPSSTQDLASDPHLDEDYLTLSTIHSAKGLEWDSVFVMHAADGNIPSGMATDSPEQIEEERRLFYVALTRAKQNLYVTVPQRFYTQPSFKSDNHAYVKPSRFITKKARKFFDSTTPPRDACDLPDETATSGKTADIRSSMKLRWD